MPPTIITEVKKHGKERVWEKTEYFQIEEAEKELGKCRKRLNEVEGSLRYEENERQKCVMFQLLSNR